MISKGISKAGHPLLLAFFVITIMAPVRALPETIELKDGKIIVGEIVEEAEGAVAISKDGGSVVYSISRDRIKNIRGSTEDEIEDEKAKLGLYGATRDSEQDTASRDKLIGYKLEQYEKEVEAAKKARGRIKIKFLDDRFGVVNVTLNKKITVPMLADTGASMVVISREVANRLGLEGLDEKGKIVAILADGSSTTAIPVTLDSVQVGSSKAKNVRAAVSAAPPGAGIEGLLGMTFLGNFHVKMDAKENSLVLEKY